MYNTWLLIFAIILGIIGTIKTISSILKMRLKDVIFQKTALGQDTEELSILQQVYDARVGIILVILSGVLQIFEKLFGKINGNIFWIVLITAIVIAVTWWLFMLCIYRKQKEKLEEKMSPEIKKNL